MESSKSPDLAYPHLKILFSSGTPMAHWTEPDFQASGERGADSPPFSQAFLKGRYPSERPPSAASLKLKATRWTGGATDRRPFPISTWHKGVLTNDQPDLAMHDHDYGPCCEGGDSARDSSRRLCRSFVKRWVAPNLLSSEKNFRKIMGYRSLRFWMRSQSVT